MTSINDLIAQADKAYKDAELRGSGIWYPEDGVYSAVVSNFLSEVRKTREGLEFAHFRVDFTLTSPGDTENKETAATFDNRPWVDPKDKKEHFFGLSKMKTMAATLNDGEAPPTMAEAASFLEANAASKTPVQIKVETSQTKKGKKFTEVTVVEVGS